MIQNFIKKIDKTAKISTEKKLFQQKYSNVSSRVDVSHSSPQKHMGFFPLCVQLNLLEVKRQVCGNDADVKQVLHVLKLTLLEVTEDVQALQTAK